jgi:hypothetical protein
MRNFNYSSGPGDAANRLTGGGADLNHLTRDRIVESLAFTADAESGAIRDGSDILPLLDRPWVHQQVPTNWLTGRESILHYLADSLCLISDDVYGQPAQIATADNNVC